ncbi:MAG: multidrug effflux MFS transporter [Phycisphaeraceae bacterium]|nr:multidrug effflux MFS transporter [Phycisphaeraceae bacterium]
MHAKATLRDVVFLALIAALPPMATDMYLAAMPVIAEQWRVPTNQVGLTLVLWFVSFSVGLLLCGPVSDHYGRKPVLIGGLTLFAGASLACAGTGTVGQLILCRILQGAGAAGPSSMCMAICRDRFEGQQRKTALAWLGVILAVAPMVSPMIGAMMLKAFHWRAIFIVQGAAAMIPLAASIRFRETIASRVPGHIGNWLARYVVLLGNRRYVMANKVMGLLIGPYFGYLAIVSMVYIEFFKLSEQMFSILFGINAGMSMLGAFVCTRLVKFMSDGVLLTLCMVGGIAGGLGIVLFGGLHPLGFAVPMGVCTFCGGMSRPLSNHLVLEQVHTDVGSASSFMVFYQFMVAAGCMAIASMPWSRPIQAYGMLAMALPAGVLLFWPTLWHRLQHPSLATPSQTPA